MKYSASEPLARNIDRHVQLSYPFYMFDEKSFEIDDNGHPWWICPVQDRKIGLFGGTTITRVVLCDAVTGECQNLKVEDVPQWVDRVFPAELLITQYNWYGSLNNGWFNSWLGQAGVVQTTPGNNGEVGYNYIAKDDDVWVYTGVTSVTSDSSIIGFVLINQRTQETHFYSVAGATETAAMSSAEGQVQHLRYSADGETWTALAWLTAVTLRAHLHVAAGAAVEAVGLRLTFSKPGAVRWIWAGEPFQPGTIR